MDLASVKKLAFDPYYSRLYQDLLRGKRQRVITPDEYLPVLEVLNLPSKVPAGEFRISQIVLDEARMRARRIKASIRTGALRYEIEPPTIYGGGMVRGR